MARDPGETNSFITVDHDVLCYWLTVTPSPSPFHRTSLSEYLINPSELNNSIYSTSQYLLESWNRNMRMRVRGIFIVEKLLFQLIEMLGGNERPEKYIWGLWRLNPFLNTSSVLVHSDKIYFFLIFPFHLLHWEFPFIGQLWVWFIKENDEKSSSNGKFWWIQQRENNAGVIVLPAGLRWHQGGT